MIRELLYENYLIQGRDETPFTQVFDMAINEVKAWKIRWLIILRLSEVQALLTVHLHSN
jgi:hypothetical protein